MSRLRLNSAFCRLVSAAAVLSLLIAGCQTAQDYSLTYKLWTNEEMRHFNEPVPNAHLELFELEQGDDVLVQYDEVREKNGQVCRRAYLLRSNAGRIATKKKPRLVDSSRVSTRHRIPTGESISAITNAAPGLVTYAIIAKGGHEFTLYRAGQADGTYALPVYLESGGTVVRVAVTPLAVAGDAVMVGLVASVVGFVAACFGSAGYYGWNQGAYPVNSR
ncbi:MAG: hypothetical protein ACYDH9_09445 [Limisphaerales bacterium]